jgi:hypothetical protein
MAPGRGRANPEDEAALAGYADALATAVEGAIGPWVVRSVERLLVAYTGRADPKVLTQAEAAGDAARDDVGGRVRALLAEDIDEQRSTPLAILRSAAVRYPTGVLEAAGVPPVVRDEFAERAFPDDVYDLTPATFADIDTSLHEPGLVWGAAKAHVHLARRAAEGLR